MALGPNIEQFSCDGCGRTYNLTLATGTIQGELCPDCYEAKGKPADAPLLPRTAQTPNFQCPTCHRTFNPDLQQEDGNCPDDYEAAHPGKKAAPPEEVAKKRAKAAEDAKKKADKEAAAAAKTEGEDEDEGETGTTGRQPKKR